jgi:uncharacterized protein (TIGR00297 family)
MNSDVFILIALVLSTVFTVFITRVLYQKEVLSFEVSRKLLHMIAIGISAFAVLLSSQIFLLTLIAGVSLPVLFLMILRGFFKNPKTGYSSWGIFYYALAYFVLLLLFKGNLPFVFYAMLTLAVADGLAAITGNLFGRNQFSIGEMSKTWEGSLVFLFSCIFCLGIVPVWFPHFGKPMVSLPAILIVSLALTLGESIFEKGTDNLIIPALLVYWMYIDLQFINYAHVASSIGIIGFGVLAYRYKALTLSGSIAAVLMGLILIISPKPIWTVPAIALFVFGTILSKIPGGEENHQSQRDVRQVLANGAIPTIALMFYMAIGNPAFLFASVAGFAASLSDTASSEIGTRMRHKTFSILTGKRVSAGLSGGVSIIGLFAGLIFSLFIASIALYISSHMGLYYFLLIGLAGFAGNLIDSLIGDKWQVKYGKGKDGPWFDTQKDSDFIVVKGVHWMNNDMVNFLAVGASSILGFCVYYYL